MLLSPNNPGVIGNDWKQRWLANQIGFHEGTPNKHLVQHWASLGVRKRARILVPLCGAAADIRWFVEQGHQVTGIEMVPEAIERFFADSGLTPQRVSAERAIVWSAGPISIVQGNIFDIGDRPLGKCDAVYDRAAITAMPEKSRPGYRCRLSRWLVPRAPGLVVSMTYDTSKKEGPPYSVSDDEILKLWPGAVRVGGGPLTEERWLGLDAAESVWTVSE